MSYTQPKYINESNADLLQNMQSKIDQAVDTSKRTIAAEKYRSDVFNNQRIVKAGNASANVIKKISDQDYGDQFTTSKVDGFFDTYETTDGRTITFAERAKELTMEMNQKPRPENYGELQAELNYINSSPESVKTALTNLTSQLDIEGREVDLTGDSNPLLAAYVLMGKPNFKPGESGFDYKIRRKGNTTEFVFTGSAEIDGETISFPPEGYVLNEKDLAALEQADKNLIQGIPSETAQINSAIRDSQIFKGAEYNDKDERTGGDFSAQINLYRMDGDPKPGETTTVMKVRGSDMIAMGLTGSFEPDKIYDFQAWNIDTNKVRKAMQESINSNVAEFIDPTTGDVDRARSYWNNRLAPSLGTEVMEVDLIREAFGQIDEVAKMEDGPAKDKFIQEKWQEAIGAWPSDLDKLTEYQRAAFHKVYTDRVVNQVVSEMNRDANARRTGAFVDEEQSIVTAQSAFDDISEASQGNIQGILTIEN